MRLIKTPWTRNRTWKWNCAI